jgi:hypothetical protein
MSIVSDPTTVEKLVRYFIAYSLTGGAADVVTEAKRVARVLTTQEPSLAQWLHHEIPYFTREAADSITAIQHALAGGALVARDLLSQCEGDLDRAQSLIFLFTRDWARLFTGVSMERRWIEDRGRPEELDR